MQFWLTNKELKQERKENSTYLCVHIKHSQGGPQSEDHAIKLKGCHGKHCNILHIHNSINIWGSKMLSKCKTLAEHYQFSEGGGLVDLHKAILSIMLNLLARCLSAAGQILKSLFSPSPRGCSHRDHRKAHKGAGTDGCAPLFPILAVKSVDVTSSKNDSKKTFIHPTGFQQLFYAK